MRLPTSSMHPTAIVVTCKSILCFPSDSEVRRHNTFQVFAAVKDSLCWLLWIFVFLFRCARKDSHSNCRPLASRLSYYVPFYPLTHWTWCCVPGMWNKTKGWLTHITWIQLKVRDALNIRQVYFVQKLWGHISLLNKEPNSLLVSVFLIIHVHGLIIKHKSRPGFRRKDVFNLSAFTATSGPALGPTQWIVGALSTE